MASMSVSQYDFILTEERVDEVREGVMDAKLRVGRVRTAS